MLNKISSPLFLIVALLGFFIYVNGQQELFSVPTSEKTASVDKARYKANTEKTYVKRHRLVSHIKGVLNAKKQKISLTLFPDTKYTVNLEKVEAEGVVNLWTGTMEGVPISTVEIYYDGKNMEGRIDTGERLFSFNGLDGLILVREIDKKTMPSFANDQVVIPSPK